MIVYGHGGVPVMLADVAPSGVSRVDPNAASGNPRHDTRSGKFGSGGGGGGKRVTPPANVDRSAYLRMLDAIREAARSYSGKLTPENIQAFIAKRAQNPAAVNIQAFMQAAAQQQLHDVVDVLDNELRTVTGPKMTAPRGYIQKVLAGASDDDVSEIIARLAARGNDAAKAAKLVIGRAGRDRKEALQAKVQAADFEDQSWAVELDDEEEPPLDPVQLVAALAEKIEIPAPVVHLTPQITVEVPPPGPVRKEIVRDANGLAVGVREVPDAS